MAEDNEFQKEITEWIKKCRFEMEYLEYLLEKYRLDDDNIYIELEQLKLDYNKFIRNLKKVVAKY